MKYYCNLYLSEEYQEKKQELIDDLEKKFFHWNQYLLVLKDEGVNQLEIFHSILLKQKVFEQEGLLVIGIANGMDDAYAMVEKITQEVYNETKTTELKGYLLERQREYEEGIA